MIDIQAPRSVAALTRALALQALLRQWRFLVGCTLGCALVAGAGVLLLRQLAPQYSSEATVLLTGSKYQVKLDERFTSTDLLSGTGQSATALAARAEEYRTLALSPEISASIRQSLGSVPPYSARVSVRGTLVTVNITTRTPEDAERIANAYAQAVATRLDAAYSQNLTDREQFAREYSDADAQYLEAERKLTEFTRTSQIDTIKRELDQKQLLRSTIVQQQSAVVVRRLAYLYASLLEATRLRSDAVVLREQVASAGQSSAALMAHALTLVDLQQRLSRLGASSEQELAFGQLVTSPSSGDPQARSQQAVSDLASLLAQLTRPSEQRSRQIDFQISGESLVVRASREQLLQDIDGLLATAGKRQEELGQQLQQAIRDFAQASATAGTNVPATGSAETDQAVQAMVNQLDADIRTLTAQLREQTLQQSRLSEAVERAKTVRQLLQNKLSETTVAAAGSGKAVVASSASPAILVSSPELPVVLAVGALLGFLAGSGIVLGRLLVPALAPSAPSAEKVLVS
ncbi:MAG: hypothetical protein K6U89_04385 [Chloroflexi bacterium]|nr:hypothetical protein [Chloroflexota bacterium]